MRCPVCGFENPAGFRFCGRCGTALPAAAPAGPAGERRQITLMFCDLVGSTALSTQVDPEELRELVRAYQAACAGVIDRLDGHIAQYLGDGVVAYFGFPRAHEDDAVRAVRAGLEIVEAMADLNARLQAGAGPLAVRIGIHTGLVVVGEMGAGSRLELLALGETPNIAARLQALAEQDTVVISGATARLLRATFECQNMGLHLVKGVPTPVQVFRVIGERRAPGTLEAVATGVTPLVGRSRELDVLLDRWARVRGRHGQVVAVSGEAGIGKTRLLQALRELLVSDGAIWLECRGSPYHQHSALYPIVGLVELILEFTREENPPQRMDRLETTLRRYGMSTAETIPLFASLLSLPAHEQYPLPALSPVALRQRTLEAILAWLRAMSETAPVLLIVENLHWIDPSTLELLSLLVDRASASAIMVLMTSRPEFSQPWGQRAYLTEIDIERLSKDDTEAMVHRLTGGRSLPSEVFEQIVTRTDGIPLFVEELTRMVLESGLVVERNGRYELTGPLPPLAIPTTLQDSLMARLDRLATVKSVAQMAATLGRSFTFELFQAVAQLDGASLRRELDKLVEAGLLYQEGAPPQATYTFKHALIQDAAYQSLLRATRQQYHRRIALALVERFPGVVDTQPEVIAQHFTAARLAAEAVGYWYRAGQRALERSANLEAIAHLRKGLELVVTLPDGPQRIQDELMLHATLGVPLLATRGYAAPEVGATFARARELCAILGDPPQLFPVLWGLWAYYLVRCDFAQARELSRHLLVIAEAHQDPALLVEAHTAMGQTFFWMECNLEASRRHCERALELYDVDRHRGLALTYSQDPAVASLSNLSFVLWLMGYPDQALARSREAQQLAEHLGHGFTRAYHYAYAAATSQMRRDLEAARDIAEAGMAFCAEQGFLVWLLTTTYVRGWVAACEGQPETAIPQIRGALDGWVAAGALLSRPLQLSVLADAHRHLGQFADGLAVTDEALATVEQTGEDGFKAELLRLRGELLRLDGAGGDHRAEASLLESLDVARRQGAKSWELRTTMSLARLWRDQGKREQARGALAAIHGWFTEGFQSADLRDAATLLADLG